MNFSGCEICLILVAQRIVVIGKAIGLCAVSDGRRCNGLQLAQLVIETSIGGDDLL